MSNVSAKTSIKIHPRPLVSRLLSERAHFPAGKGRRLCFSMVWIASNMTALLIGWTSGGGMLTHFFASPARVALLCFWMVGSLWTARISAPIARSEGIDPHGFPIARLLKIFSFGLGWTFLLVLLARREAEGRWTYPESFWAIRSIGVALFIMGGGLRFAAIQARNRAQAQGMSLATTGPYARIRHPEYLGILLLLLGLMWVFRSRLDLWVTALWSCVISRHIINEETALQRNTDYAAYQVRVPRRLL